MSAKKTDIFIKSYKADFKLLNYALLSIAKYLTGYNKLVLVIPKAEENLFTAFVFIPKGISIDIHFVDEYGSGYMYQQLCKIGAHKFTESDFIMFTDSDCIFDHEVNLQDLIVSGKPEILHTSWNKVGTGIIWREPTETMMGEPVEFEFMRRNQMCFHRQTLVNIAKWQPNLEHIIMSLDKFSEFNLMGAYAYKYERKNYNFVNTDNWKYVSPLAVQLWSYAGKDGSETHQTEYKRTIETINKALGLNITEL